MALLGGALIVGGFFFAFLIDRKLKQKMDT